MSRRSNTMNMYDLLNEIGMRPVEETGNLMLPEEETGNLIEEETGNLMLPEEETGNLIEEETGNLMLPEEETGNLIEEETGNLMLPEEETGNLMLPEEETGTEASGPITIASLFTERPTEMAKPACTAMQTCKQDLQVELLKCMECPVCYKYMISVIEECSNGHCICPDCRRNIRSCPQCKSDFTGQRNRFAEKMAALLTFPCQNFDVGCLEMMSGEKLISHHSFCQWRLYNCFVLDCEWTGRSYDILDHFKREHRVNLLKGEANIIIWKNVNFTEDKKNCYLLHINDYLFICTQEIIQNIFALVVQFIGPREKASNFQYKLELMSGGKEYQAVFIYPVMVDTKTATNIFKSGGGIQLAVPFIKTFVSGKNNLVHKLEVIAKE